MNRLTLTLVVGLLLALVVVSPRSRAAETYNIRPSFQPGMSWTQSSDTDINELTVAPNSSPLHSVAMTATPVGKVPITDRMAVCPKWSRRCASQRTSSFRRSA